MNLTIPSFRAGVSRLSRLLFVALLFAFGQSLDAHGQAVSCPPNIDFSYGNMTNWYCWTGASSAGVSSVVWTGGVFTGPIGPPATTVALSRHMATSGLGVDPYGGFSVTAPGGGLFSSKLGNEDVNSQAERMQYYVHVPAGFNNYSFAFKYAVVFQDLPHTPDQQPAFIIHAFDSATGNDIPCATLTYISAAGLPGFQLSSAAQDVWYLPWTNGTLNLSGQGGKTIVVEVTSYDCAGGAHFGYGYFDVVSCGQFTAAVTYCNLSANIITLQAPSGYKSYKWYKGPAPISGAPVSVAPSFNITNPNSPVYYICVLEPYNSNGCPDTIRTRVISDFSINATPDTTCNTLGSPIQLDVTTTGGLGGWTYQWTADPTIIGPLNIRNPIAAPTGSGMYVVTVADSFGCYRRDTVIIQNPAFKINLGPDITTCLGTPVTINPTLTPSSPGYIFKWSPGTGLNNTTILKPTYTPYGTLGTFDDHLDTFILRVDSGVCAAADTIRIRTLPDHFDVVDTAVCEMFVFKPHVDGHDAFNYVWAPNIPSLMTFNPDNHRQISLQADTTRTFQITAKYPNCPDVVRNITIRVEPLPNVDLGFDSIQKCFYTPLYLTAHVKPAWFTQYTYLWKADDNIDIVTSPIITFTGPKDTTLMVTVSTPLGCTGTDSVRISVYEGSFGKVKLSDTAVCPHTPVTMAAAGGISYVWRPSIYLSDSTSPTVTANPQTTTDYTLYVTDKNGCVDTLPVSLRVFSEAQVSLPDSTELYPGGSYQMDPGGNALYFTWFPVVGLTNPGISNPVASPSVNTRYFLTGTTEAGCQATDSIFVMVHEESELDMANAFTPGVAPNPEFKVSHRGIASLKSFRIYNRWGTKVFETSDINKGWNGQFNGVSQPMGVYVYTVEAITNKGRVVSKQGNVTLLQ